MVGTAQARLCPPYNSRHTLRPHPEQPLDGGRFWLPRGCSCDDGIDEDKEFSSASDESHFVSFAVGPEAFVEGDELRIPEEGRWQSGRVKAGTQASSAALDVSAASPAT